MTQINPTQITPIVPAALVIYTYPAMCIELRYAAGEPVESGDCIPHYASEHTARAEAATFGVPGEDWGIPVPHPRAGACVTICCNRCGCLLDEDDYVTHFTDVAEALGYARDGGTWLVNAEGAWCGCCVDLDYTPDGRMVRRPLPAQVR